MLEYVISGNVTDDGPTEDWPHSMAEAEVKILIRHETKDGIVAARAALLRVVTAACLSLEAGTPPDLIALASIVGLGTAADPYRPA